MLSGGQRKLLELARVLMADPRIILLDEPAAGVNPSLIETIIARISEINARGVTLLIIEHNMSLARPAVPRSVRDGGRPARLPGTARPKSSATRSVIDAYLGGGVRMNRPTVLRADDLVAGYERGVPIVRGASIDVAAGEIVAILGPNGAGKSTLIKAIVGLVPKFAGQVTLEDADITALPAHEMVRHGLAFVPQTENVFTSMSVDDNLALAAAILPQA